MTKTRDTAMPALPLGEAGSDPIEDRLRANPRYDFSTNDRFIWETYHDTINHRGLLGLRARQQTLFSRALSCDRNVQLAE